MSISTISTVPLLPFKRTPNQALELQYIFNTFYFGVSEGIFDGFTGAIYEVPLERRRGSWDAKSTRATVERQKWTRVILLGAMGYKP